jgi:hypothetical protein
MLAIRPTVPVIAAALVVSGCSSTTVVERPAPATGRSTAVVLGIPPGHLPPPGQCRVWIPGRPPGRQARARACDGILATAPAGAWVLYRPGRDRRLVHVRHVHETRTGVIVRVRVFEAESGKYVREERP